MCRGRRAAVAPRDAAAVQADSAGCRCGCRCCLTCLSLSRLNVACLVLGGVTSLCLILLATVSLADDAVAHVVRCDGSA